MNEVHIQYSVPYTQHCGFEDTYAINGINSFKAKISVCLFEEVLIIRSRATARLEVRQ